MKRSWKTVIGPALEAARPQSIVEIGSFEGENTRNLLDLCEKTDAVLHVVDPAPRYDVNELGDRYGERFVFHEALSLDALPQIDEIDAVLIDGDHNWYTVFNELKRIDYRSGDFPLVILHDIFWPFGRRDMYYGPETIPEPYRKPHQPKGVRPGEKGLLEEGGLGQGLEKALEEGGPQNGVLTGVEDFLKQTGRDLEFVTVPGFHGLGLLFPPRLREESAEFGRFLDTWDLPPTVSQHLENLEEAWLGSEIYRLEVQARMKRLRRQRDQLEQNAREQVRDEELQRQNARLRRQRRVLQEQLEEVTDTRTWRTRKALKKLKRRILGSGKKKG